MARFQLAASFLVMSVRMVQTTLVVPSPTPALVHNWGLQPGCSGKRSVPGESSPDEKAPRLAALMRCSLHLRLARSPPMSWLPRPTQPPIYREASRILTYLLGTTYSGG